MMTALDYAAWEYAEMRVRELERELAEAKAERSQLQNTREQLQTEVNTLRADRDVVRALAKTFSHIWNTLPWQITIIGIKNGLIERDPEIPELHWNLTDLGRRALALAKEDV